MKNSATIILLFFIATPLFSQVDDEEEIVKVVEVVDGGIKLVKESDLYEVWKEKRLESKIATIKNVAHIIDKEEYEPLKNVLSEAKFIGNSIRANGKGNRIQVIRSIYGKKLEQELQIDYL